MHHRSELRGSEHKPKDISVLLGCGVELLELVQIGRLLPCLKEVRWRKRPDVTCLVIPDLSDTRESDGDAISRVRVRLTELGSDDLPYLEGEKDSTRERWANRRCFGITDNEIWYEVVLCNHEPAWDPRMVERGKEATIGLTWMGPLKS
jgi:hypothetical protein